MPRIAIVGAGQVGLHLGVGLVRRGHQVTVISNRTADEIRSGSVLSSQAMLAPNLDLERAEDLELWEESAPLIQGMHVTWLSEDGEQRAKFSCRRGRPALSVDQRVKMPEWMDVFENLGGHLEVAEVTPESLATLAEQQDLVVVAAGKGDISGLFPNDEARREFTSPQRHLALAYLEGVEAHEGFEGNDFVKRDGVGEVFMFPAITLNGGCHIVTVEAIPGGPLDVFTPGMSAEALTRKIVEATSEMFPTVSQRLKNARPTDAKGTLAGRFAPTRRAASTVLPNARRILAAGDVIALNDPLTGQGANNAAKCAALLLEAISERGEAPYDGDWVAGVGERLENMLDASSRWTNAMLRPWPEHVRADLAGAKDGSSAALEFVEAFGDPEGALHRWVGEESATGVRL